MKSVALIVVDSTTATMGSLTSSWAGGKLGDNAYLSLYFRLYRAVMRDIPNTVEENLFESVCNR